MTRLAIAINLDRCVGCHTCALSCKMQNNVPEGMLWNRVLTEDCDVMDGALGTYPNVTRTFLPVACQHCQNAACQRVCPTGATYKDDKGRVEIDYDKCIGCRMCMSACPYNGVRSFNWEEPAFHMDYAMGSKDVPEHQRHVVEKCTFCYHRTSQGIEPACMHLCVGRARFWGDLDDPNSEAAKVVAAAGENAHYLFDPADLHPTTVYILSEKTAKWQEEPVEVTRYEKK